MTPRLTVTLISVFFLAVGNRELQIVLNLATILNHTMEQKKLPVADLEAEHGRVYLPDATNHMREAHTLCFNDCSWLPDQKDMEFAHQLIPYKIAKTLGVNTKRQVRKSRTSLVCCFHGNVDHFCARLIL